MRRLICALMLALIALPAPAQPFGEERRYFRDWLAACRTDGYCSATAYDNPNPAGVPVADHVLRVGRHPQGTYWEISVATVVPMADPGSSFTLTVDGAAVDFQSPHDVGAYGSINDFFFIDTRAQELFDLMGPGATLVAAFTDTDGRPQQARFSLAGLTAALTFIDEHQGRLGAERVAMAPPMGLMPVVADGLGEVPAAVIDLHRMQADCDPLEYLPHGRDAVVAALGDTDVLYLMPCLAGAYNFGYLAYVGDGSFYQQIYFADYADHTGWGGTPFLINPHFDEATGALTQFNRGRGLGDCGNWGEWRWVGDAFRLIEYRHQGECDGTVTLEDFPVIYGASSTEGT